MMRRLILRILIGSLLALLALFLIVRAVDVLFFQHADFRKVKAGMSEIEVRSLLGPPATVYHRPKTDDNAYKIDGYSFVPFKETGEVYTYFGGDEVCYILLQEDTAKEICIGDS